MKTTVTISGFGDLDLGNSLSAVRSQRIANLSATALSDEDKYTFLAQISVDTFDLAQQLVPVDTGYLKASGSVVASGWVYIISYTASYAPYVHEIMGNRHAAPTQAKFLQDAFTQVMQGLIASYGVQSIPDFDVNLTADIDAGLSLVLMLDKKGIGEQGMSWRRFIIS